MREKIRDKTRDVLADHLNSIGVEASLSERKRPEESIGNKWWRRSLGVIDIATGPISFINVVKKDRSKDSPPKWWIFLCVPHDKELPESRSVNIRTKRRKSFPIFGSVVGVDWKGEDRGHGLAKKLSDDQQTDNLAADIGNIRLQTLHDDFSGWSIEIDRKINPTREQWESLERIALVAKDSIPYF